MPVRNPDTLRERLNALHDTSGLSWRKIAALDEFAGISAGTLCSIANGWEPAGAELRHALGLPATVPVIPVNGAVIPPRTQVHHADECVDCARPFVSNHPRRQRCFICSPFRGKRR